MSVRFFSTYIGGGSLVGPRTGEGDKFMTALVDHKTAHCGEEKSEMSPQASLQSQISRHSSNKEMNQYVNYVALVAEQ